MVIEENSTNNLQITWPSIPETEALKTIFLEHPNGKLFRGIFEVMDGACIPCAHYIDTDKKNSFYIR